MQCDPASATCVPAPLPRYERPLPGRAARITSAAAHVWVASLDTADGAIVVTEIDQDGTRNPRVVATPSNRSDRRLAINASGRLLAVAWLTASGRYDLAYRSLPGPHATWNFTTVEPASGESYFGTEDFDLAVVEDRGLAIAFRDRDRTLRVLTTDEPLGGWTVETADDGGPTDDGIICPDERRQVDPAQGVGRDPDVTSRGEQVIVAYQDIDCGDLRLARRGEQRWTVSSVDTGDLSVEGASRAFVGRWPSIAFNPAGEAAIAYQDVSRGRLMLADEENGVFATEVVDAGIAIDAFSRERKNIVGAFATLTLDDASTATITYFDATTGDLRLARRDGNGGDWSRVTLANSGAVGFFADHTLEAGLGRFVVAERLTPSGTGFTSELVIVEADQ